MFFEQEDYREFIKLKLKEFPNNGHGKMSELARAIGVHSTLISQVLKGIKDLSSDQILLVAKFFTLSEMETDYLGMLLLLNRSGNPTAKKFFKEKLLEIRKNSKNLSKRVKKDVELSEEQKAIYYSDWTYAAICQAVALARIRTLDDVARFLSISKSKAAKNLEFLYAVGLVINEDDGLKNGATALHLSKSSPWIRCHHINWRQKAVENFSEQGEEDLHYSAPLTLSSKDAQKLFDRVAKLVEEMRSIVDPSPSEDFYCLNVDWFKVAKK